MKKARYININLSLAAYKPYYQEMYAVAYVVTGNERQAEEALMNVICAFPYPGEDDYKTLFMKVREEAAKLAEPEKGEYFTHSQGAEESGGALCEYLASMPENQMRCVLLRYAISLSPREISSVTGEKLSEIKAVLEKTERRAVKIEGREKSGIRLLRACSRALVKSACYAPDVNALFRAVEARANREETESFYAKSLRGVFAWGFTLAFLILSAIIIWLGAIMIRYYRDAYIAPSAPPVKSETADSEETQCPF